MVFDTTFSLGQEVAVVFAGAALYGRVRSIKIFGSTSNDVEYEIAYWAGNRLVYDLFLAYDLKSIKE